MSKYNKNYCISCGIEISEYAKRCYSCANTGKNHPNYGKHPSLATRKKISLSNKGKKRSLEIRKRMSLALMGDNNPMYGKKLSKEHKKKIILALSGKNNHNYGKHHSRETRKKIGLGNKGKKLSLETKKRIGASTKERLKNPKNHPMYGEHHSLKSKKIMSLARGGTGTPYENSEYGPDFDSPLKERIRFRDKYKCRKCGCTQLENGRQLDVHHWDYNKKDNREIKLIALCRSCHMKTNYDRVYWRQYFNNIIIKKYCNNT